MWPFNRATRPTSDDRSSRPVIDLGNPEARTSPENPRVPLSSAGAFASLFGSWQSAAGVLVTREVALGVPAIWSAVNFLAGTIAALPVPVYEKKKDGRERAETHPIAVLLHDWVNDDYLTSFNWRKQAMQNVLLDGHSLTFIEGKRTVGKVTNLWPLDPKYMTVSRVVEGGVPRRKYVYRDGSRTVTYDVDEIIDIAFFMNADGLSSVSPVDRLRNSIGLSIAMETYASKFFLNGGVPPLAMQMPAGASGNASTRATANIEELVKGASGDKLVLPMPAGHRLEPIGFDPEKGQLVESRMMQLREIARIYNLPPVFLQDLEFGTFANTEQQDLLLVKHTLMQWLKCWEGELNAKLFGPRSKFYMEFNADGLLRGDFQSRMEGLSKGIQNALLTPDEARAIENRPSMGGDAAKLHIQGATVPLGEQTKVAAAKPPANTGDTQP